MPTMHSPNLTVLFYFQVDKGIAAAVVVQLEDGGGG